jgi:hypothetical protein
VLADRPKDPVATPQYIDNGRYMPGHCSGDQERAALTGKKRDEQNDGDGGHHPDDGRAEPGSDVVAEVFHGGYLQTGGLPLSTQR